MKNMLISTVILATGICPLGRAQAHQPVANQSAKQPENSQVERGKYIVEDLSVCEQCHTPRDSNGMPEHSHRLEGAPVWLKSAEPVADWPLQAPRIGGSPPGTDEEMVTLLTTGVWRDGKYLRPPMPQFRMSRPDAEAVIAYLKSVKNQPN